MSDVTGLAAFIATLAVIVIIVRMRTGCRHQWAETDKNVVNVFSEFHRDIPIRHVTYISQKCAKCGKFKGKKYRGSY